MGQGYLRVKTRPQGDRPIFHEQKNFGQGLNVDIPATDFDNNANQNLENQIAFERYTEGRSGTVHIHDLPGSGTVHSIAVHPDSKIAILHRGTQIWELKTVDVEIKSFLALTATTVPQSFGIDKSSTLKVFGNNFLIHTDDGIFQILIEYTNKSFFQMNSGQPLDSDDFVSTVQQLPFKYGITYTFAIIVDTTTGLAVGTGDRFTAGQKLIWESPPVISGNMTVFKMSYYNIRPFSTELDEGATMAIRLGAKDIAAGLEQKVTHLAVYQTPDLGANGLGNLEFSQFCFSTDSEMQHTNYATTPGTANQSQLQALARLKQANTRLRTVGFQALPSGLLGEVTEVFVFSGRLNDKQVDYSQRIPDDTIVGFHNPATQFHEFDDSVTVLAKTPDMLSIMTNKKSYTSVLTSFVNVGVFESVLTLTNFKATDDTLGVSDRRSFIKIEDGAYISICSDKSVRVWDGSGWSRDLAEDRVRRIIERIEEGSTVGAYYRGAYFIWFQTDDSPPTGNGCMRLSVKRESGKGWTFYTGDDWSYPSADPFVGANFLDTTQPNLEFLFIPDESDNKIYWAETFAGPEGLLINTFQITQYWADKVSVASPNGTSIFPKIRTRDVTGARESFNLKHSESHAYLTDIINQVLPVDISNPPASGVVYPELFVDAIAFVDGSQVSVETAGKVQSDGDIQFWYRVEGSRIAIEFQMNRSGFRVRGLDSRFRVQDILRPNKGPSNTVASTYQNEMFADLIEWHFSRPRLFVDRTRQKVMPGGLVTTKIGPDTRNSAIKIGENLAPFERFKFPSTKVYSGEFTISFWISDVQFMAGQSTTIVQFQDAASVANFTLQAIDLTTLTILEGVGTVTVDDLDGNGPVNGFHQIMLVRTTGSDVRVYQNDTFKGTLTFVGSFGGGFFQAGGVA